MEYGVEPEKIYADKATGTNTKWPEFDACPKSLRKGDSLLVWKLDRLGRNMKDLITKVNDLSEKDFHFKFLVRRDAEIVMATVTDRMIFGILSSLAEYEQELTRDRIQAGLEVERARGKRGGRKLAFTKAKF